MSCAGQRQSRGITSRTRHTTSSASCVLYFFRWNERQTVTRRPLLPMKVFCAPATQAILLRQNVASRCHARRSAAAVSSQLAYGVHDRPRRRFRKASLVAPVSCFVHALLFNAKTIKTGRQLCRRCRYRII